MVKEVSKVFYVVSKWFLSGLAKALSNFNFVQRYFVHLWYLVDLWLYLLVLQ